MQILQAEQNKLSPVYLELNEYKTTLEEVLKINTNKEYKKNILSILDEVNHKTNELNSIFFNDDQFILKITKKHQEIKELFHKIINLSREFNQQKIIELTLDNVRIKDISTDFIISDHIVQKAKKINYSKSKNYNKIIEILEKAIKQIKYTEPKYLQIKEKKAYKTT